MTRVSGTPNRLKIAMRILITDSKVSDERVDLYEVTKIVTDNQQNLA